MENIKLIWEFLTNAFYAGYYSTESEKTKEHKTRASVIEDDLIVRLTDSRVSWLWFLVLYVMLAVAALYYMTKESLKLTKLNLFG